MFRRQESTLEPDPQYPACLQELGYFIDDSPQGCTRNIKAPDQFFDFFYTNNDRHNEVRGEAMQTCQREHVLKRLSALGIKQLYLPTLTYTRPNGPHIQILAPPAEVLKARKRVIVIVNDDTHQDLGILAYRQLQRDGGLNGGSIINFVKDLSGYDKSDANVSGETSEDGAGVKNKEQIPGLIVLNAGQLLYSHKFNKALSIRSWNALPRKSISHDAIAVHPVENRVEGHRTVQEHIKTVFDSVIKNSDFVAPNAEVYVIAIENGSEKIVDVLNEDFWDYGDRIMAMAIVQSRVNNAQISDPALKAFLHMRTRQWRVVEANSTDLTRCIDLPSDYKPGPSTTATEGTTVNWLETTSSLETVDHRANAQHRFANSPYKLDSAQISTPEPSTRSSPVDCFFEADPICPTFPGGDTWVGECIFTQRAVQQTILQFFEEVARNTKNYYNPAFTYENALRPSAEKPLTLFIPTESALDASGFEAISQDMPTNEQQVLDSARVALHVMKSALLVTPSNTPELAEGRQHLEERIARKQVELKELEKKALTAQKLALNWERETNREKWVPPKTGHAIPFAGVEADSEVVKEAGCLDTVEEELERLELEDMAGT